MPYNPALGTRPEDLQPNNFSPVGTAVNYEENIYDRPIPEQFKVYARHQENPGWGMLLRAMGTVRGCSNPSTGHYEEPWKDDLLEGGAIITPAGGAGNPMVVELTAASMYNTSATIGGAARQASYILEKDVIEFPSGNQARVSLKNVGVTPHRVTIEPLLSTVDLDGEFVINTGYHIVTNLWGEGTGTPGVRQPRYVKYSNTFGIVKSATAITGSEMTNHIYQEPVPGKRGTIRLRLSADMFRSHEKAVDGLLLFGTQANNIVDLETDGLNVDVNVVGSEGYVPFVKTGGTTVNPTLATYTIDDLGAVAQVLEDERSTASNAVVGLTGSQIQRTREAAMQEFFSQDLTPFINNMFSQYNASDFDMGGVAQIDTYRDHSYNFGISAIRYNQIDFVFKKLPVFNDIKRAGARVGAVNTYKYPVTTIYQPLGQKVKTDTSSEIPAIGYEYKEAEGTSRHMVVSTQPGAGVQNGIVSHDKDYVKDSVLSEIAPHYCVANACVYEEGV